jgi:glutamyl-Q tRNA(Asp) synthetase
LTFLQSSAHQPEEFIHVHPRAFMITGRFAPSPTGPLHYGSLVAALGSYLFARSAAGRWLLRIDDLDLPRVVPGAADDILRTLEMLGFEWDGEPVWQSRRGEAYREALAQLEASGVVYPCGCSRAEIARIASAPHGSGDELAYPGTCRGGLAAVREPRALRVRVPDGEISFCDGINGEYRQSLAKVCGDFVVRRADGLFAYHLATVVDDAAAGVNQVVRGADLLFSTPRQIYLQRLLSFSQPAYWHLPLVTAPDGAKLSKRDSAVSLAAGRNLLSEGGALLRGALQFLGQPTGGIPSAAAAREILAAAVKDFVPESIPVRSAFFPLQER